MNVAESAFQSLIKLGIIDEDGKILYEYQKFKVAGGDDVMMDFNVDWLGAQDISVAHNSILNGDVMADPDMQVRVFPDIKAAIAYTYQNDYVPVFYTAIVEDGKIDMKKAADHTAFLDSWLKEVIGWGYAPVQQKEFEKEEDEESEDGE